MDKIFKSKHQQKRISKSITRGRISPTSNDFEEQFAIFLERCLNDNYEFIVDYPISYKMANQRFKQIYPDIIVLKKGTHIIEGLFEVKIDIANDEPSNLIPKKNEGQTRNEHFKSVYLPYYSKDNWIVNVREKVKTIYQNDLCQLQYTPFNYKKPVPLEVSKEFKYAYILLSSVHGKEKYERLPVVNNLFTLLVNVHLNNFSGSKNELKDKNNQEQWCKLADYLFENYGLRG
ncbi:hypothetical protein [Peribacillus asahii]|nr:hypothetical protein [Peribacillus asahii]